MPSAIVLFKYKIYKWKKILQISYFKVLNDCERFAVTKHTVTSHRCLVFTRTGKEESPPAAEGTVTFAYWRWCHTRSGARASQRRKVYDLL